MQGQARPASSSMMMMTASTTAPMRPAARDCGHVTPRKMIPAHKRSQLITSGQKYDHVTASKCLKRCPSPAHSTPTIKKRAKQGLHTALLVQLMSARAFECPHTVSPALAPFARSRAHVSLPLHYKMEPRRRLSPHCTRPSLYMWIPTCGW
jgi:hypothetical protein